MPPDLEFDDYTLYAVVDADIDIIEENEDNNYIDKDINVRPGFIVTS